MKDTGGRSMFNMERSTDGEVSDRISNEFRYEKNKREKNEEP